MKPDQMQGAAEGPSEDYNTTENVGLSDLSETLKMKEDENQQLRWQLEREKEYTAHLQSLLNRQWQENSQQHERLLEKIESLEQELKERIIGLEEKTREHDELMQLMKRLVDKERQDKERQEETVNQVRDKYPDRQRVETWQLEEKERQLTEKGNQLEEMTRKLQEVLRQLHKVGAQRDEMWNLIAHNVHKGQELASGTWGVVSEGTVRLPVAIKELRDHTLESRKLFQREIEAASFCYHSNIVKFLGAASDVHSRPYMVMELMDYNLHDFIEFQKRSPPYSLRQDAIVSIALNVAEALFYLHGNEPPIVHRDLKTDNILLKGGTAKIGDLGSTRFQGDNMTANRGTLLYTAPEVLNSNIQTTQMDVWSYGLVVLEMAIGTRPDRSQLSQQIQRITCPKLQELVIACTESGPDKRPSMKKVVKVLKENFI